MAKIGYARVSTEEQNLDLQLDALKGAGCVLNFTEKASGAQRDRPQLQAALEGMQKGSTLVVWRLDRLARNLKQLVDTVEDLKERGVNFISLTENIDTSTAQGELVFHIFCALAQFERELIRERTKAGLKSARERGRLGGRPKRITEDVVAKAKALLADEQFTVEEVAKTLGMSPATLYRYLPKGGRSGLNEE